MPGHSPHHLTSVESIITDIFTRHGLLALTDVEQPMMSGGPLGLALDPDMIAEIKSKSEWDGMPSPDKLIAVLLGLVSRPKKAPPAVTTRLVGVVPATHRTVILVAHSFFPVATADTADLRKIGRWAISVRDGNGISSNFSGSILDHADMAGALELITSVCAKWKKDLGLDSLMGEGRPHMLGGGPDGLGQYVDGSAGYPHQSSYVRRRGYSPTERAADGMPELTPEQLAALRESAIQSGIFEEFCEMYPGQPPMTDEEQKRVGLANADDG
jgi:hypothetical protein